MISYSETGKSFIISKAVETKQCEWTIKEINCRKFGVIKGLILLQKKHELHEAGEHYHCLQ